MKKRTRKFTLPVFALFFLTLGSCKGQEITSEYALVENTVERYLTGGDTNDLELLVSAFDKEAKVKHISNSNLEGEFVRKYFESRIKAMSEQNRTTRIVDIKISKNAAQSTVIITNKNVMITDYLNLLKIEGNWLIVGKVFDSQNLN